MALLKFFFGVQMVANNRLPMRKIIEALRLHVDHNRTNREIAQAIGVSPTTVGQYLRRARKEGLGYPLPVNLADDAIELRLLPPVVVSKDVVRNDIHNVSQ